MKSFHQRSLAVPEGVHFEVPRDMAKYCAQYGPPGLVRIFKGVTPTGLLEIRWDDEIIQFAYGDNVVEWALAEVIEFVVDGHERVMHWTLCTLRIVFRQTDGVMGSTMASLPIFTMERREPLLEMWNDLMSLFTALGLPRNTRQNS